jgi:hypothetical protein
VKTVVGEFRPWWKAPDALWFRLVGKTEGLLCIACFGKRAEVAEIDLSWWVEATRADGQELNFESRRCSSGHWHRLGVLNAVDPETGC